MESPSPRPTQHEVRVDIGQSCGKSPCAPRKTETVTAVSRGMVNGKSTVSTMLHCGRPNGRKISCKTAWEMKTRRDRGARAWPSCQSALCGLKVLPNGSRRSQGWDGIWKVICNVTMCTVWDWNPYGGPQRGFRGTSTVSTMWPCGRQNGHQISCKNGASIEKWQGRWECASGRHKYKFECGRTLRKQ